MGGHTTCNACIPDGPDRLPSDSGPEKRGASDREGGTEGVGSLQPAPGREQGPGPGGQRLAAPACLALQALSYGRGRGSLHAARRTIQHQRNRTRRTLKSHCVDTHPSAPPPPPPPPPIH
uniref:Uncharacterized protein n=1 Tax=Eutreptiella gymnastica TaxID=73025 RepID=A0A7S4G235_9EUGL